MSPRSLALSECVWSFPFQSPHFWRVLYNQTGFYETQMRRWGPRCKLPFIAKEAALCGVFGSSIISTV